MGPLARIARLFRQQKTPSNPLPTRSALIDAATRLVLAVSDSPTEISFLNEAFMDTYHVLNITTPNYPYKLPFDLDEASYTHWMWNMKDRLFVPTRPDMISPAIRAQSELAVQKMRAVRQIIRSLTHARSRMAPELYAQESIYMTKKMQATEFRASGYDERRLLEFPHVLHYADAAAITPREAADDIIIKAKLRDDQLAKTELMRLTYFSALKKATNTSEIRPLLERFRRETFTNSFI